VKFECKWEILLISIVLKTDSCIQ